MPHTDYDSIRAYFVDFLKKKPQGTILESYVTSGPDWCTDDGIYEFKFGASCRRCRGRELVSRPASSFDYPQSSSSLRTNAPTPS